MQANPPRTSHDGQRSRRALARAALLLALAGAFVLLLIPLFAAPTEPPIERRPLPPPAARSAAEPASVDDGSPNSAPREPESPLAQPRPSRPPLAGSSPDGLALHVLRYVPLIVEVGNEVGADPAVLAALMEVEFSGEDAVSRAGALGLMQVMPDKLQPGDDPFDPPTNVRRAAEHVRRLTEAWHGDLATVAGAYFGAVDAQGFVTDASDGNATGTEYVSRFAAAYVRWATALGQPVQPVVMRISRPAPPPPVALHVVQPGDSARGLAERYGISLATLAAANQLANANLLLIGQELRIPTVDGILHTVQPGENVAALAERYGVGADTLVEANRLTEEPAPGALLVVPGPSPTWTPAPTPTPPPIAQHVVQPGDSARGLAERYGISLATLTAANELADPSRLLIGQELRIPTVDGVLHTFQPGESLAELAERYGVEPGSLVEANQLNEEPAPGALLVVPGVLPTTPEPAVEQSPEPTSDGEPPLIAEP